MLINSSRGFTLVEMAVVLVIVGLLLTGLLLPLSAQIEQRDRTETERYLAEAKEALMGYALINKYLPCPDSKAVPDGLEDTRNASGDCPDHAGILPWQTLGIQPTDSWNRYFGYSVTPAYSDSSPTFSLTTSATRIVNGDSGTLTTSGVAVIYSTGPNGLGAKSPTGDMAAPTASADEVENFNGNATFVSHTPTGTSGSSDEFDDLLTWVSQPVLANRMVSAGQLP